jgi:hypothetical protein
LRRSEERRHIGGMPVFIFQSEKDNLHFGFTGDKAGSNLPDNFAPWRPVGGEAVLSTAAIAGVASSDTVLEAIERDGYYIARAGQTTVTRQTFQDSDHAQTAKRPRDPNQLGKLIVYLATGAATAETADESGKDPAAVSWSARRP